MGKLVMSKKERRRLEAFARVGNGEWTLAQASSAMGLSYRQTKRVWARYQERGDAGLTHQGRGRRSHRLIDESTREKALLAIRERYLDFGPTLMSEYLAKEEEVLVSVSTLRRWLKSAELSTCRQRRGAKHRTRRARKEHFGELVQLDGSRHDWFEGRRDWACLMVMIDDATSRMLARFHEVESTEASMDVFDAWAKRYGLPVEVYPDRHSIYRSDREATAEEVLAGKEPLTQFGRALDSLGVRLRLAGSPQAKGRVERMNGTLQDRLVKELRLRNLSTLEEANELLNSAWFEELSSRFSVKPGKQADLHRVAPTSTELHRVLSTWESRTVGRDAVVRWSNRCFQLARCKSIGNLAKRKVTVLSRGPEVLAIFCGEVEMSFCEVESAPRKEESPAGPKGVNRSSNPSGDHPWRKPFLAPKK